LLSYPHVSPHGQIYKAQGAPLQNDRIHYPAIYLHSPHPRSREPPCNPLHKASSPGRRVLRISKRPEPVNIVSCLSCIWHKPFCYSRRHHPTPKNTLRGNPGCAVGPKTPTPLSPSYCTRQPHRRPHRRGHPPPRRGPAAIGPCLSNWPHPCDRLLPPVQQHHLPAAEPDPRRRTAADSHRRSDSGRLAPPSVAVRAVKPSPSLACGPRATAPSPAVSPSLLGQLGRQRVRARACARVGRNPPPPAQQGRKLLFFLFSLFFSHFSHIELYANILCTKNSSNKL
jgi:hypothetical protein